MASSAETHPYPANFLFHLIQATTSNVVSLITSAAPKTVPSKPLPPSKVYLSLLFADLTLPPLALSYPHSSPSDSTLTDSLFPTGHNSSPREASGRGSTAAMRIAGLSSGGKGGGPAFVGQVFSMCDLSGTGLMAVSTHFDIPFISKRTPGWMKKMFATITKSERNGPVFRFFMDLGDAVSYVKRLNIPSGVVGACRLDLAYEHFKEKPHLFQFVANEKQVKAANKILKTIPQNGGRKKVDGVPVFTAQNLDIAIATTDGIKWYTPYFFDKNMLDNILEESVDQHFDGLIQSRRTQRWQDVDDDNLAAEVVEDNKESLWEPPEVQEVMDEMGHPGIPLSVISKAAEMQLLYAVDKVLLGNRWLRKATGIQPKFPYMVDSFEKRSAASFLKASQSSKYLMSSKTACDSEDIACLGTSAPSSKENIQAESNQKPDLRFPFVDWFSHQWSKQQPEVRNQSNMRSKECLQQKLQPNPFLPKITMVGISTSEAGQMSKATLKKTMEDLTEQLEQTDRGNTSCANGNEIDDRDPLFVANIGDYFSGFRTASAQWAKGKNN